MKIAFTHNLRLTDAEEEAEFDTPETVEMLAQSLSKGNHEVAKIEVSGPASHLAARLEAFSPDLIFNLAEGRRGPARARRSTPRCSRSSAIPTPARMRIR